MTTDFVTTPHTASLQLVAGRGHYDLVIGAIATAKRSVWIATANLKELMIEDVAVRPGRRTRVRGRGSSSYRSMLALLDEMLSRGVETRILHASPPSRPFAAELKRHPNLRSKAVAPGTRAATFELRLCPRVHLKAVIIDGTTLYLGSANFTGAGLGVRGEGRRNFELGIVSRDDALLDQVQGLYETLWEGQPCSACKLREICPAPLDGSPKGVPPVKAASRKPAGPRRRKAV